MRSGSRGFTYLLLLVLLAVLAIAATGSVRVGHDLERRAAEQELLAVGHEWSAALASYRSHGGAGPAELADLLLDPRMARVHRHIRQLPHDPLTGSMEWGVIRDAAGRIAAVYSLAEGRPLKRTGFDFASGAGFDEAETYAQWMFGGEGVLTPKLGPHTLERQ